VAYSGKVSCAVEPPYLKLDEEQLYVGRGKYGLAALYGSR